VNFARPFREILDKKLGQQWDSRMHANDDAKEDSARKNREFYVLPIVAIWMVIAHGTVNLIPLRATAGNSFSHYRADLFPEILRATCRCFFHIKGKCKKCFLPFSATLNHGHRAPRHGEKILLKTRETNSEKLHSRNWKPLQTHKVTIHRRSRYAG
jgi:hypothetical protein